LFAAGTSVMAGLLFGLPACWRLMRRHAGLGGSGRSIAQGQSRVSAMLMAGEVAMAVMVLSGAALLTRSFAALINEDPGFQAKRVWAIPNLPLRRDWVNSSEFLSSRLVPTLRAVPGVSEVAAVNSAPMSLGATEHSRFATRFGIEGRVFDSGSYPVAQTRWTTPEYFRVLGIPLKRGRWLTEADRGKPAILVNATLARRFFPGQDAAGKRLVLGVMDAQQGFREIVGIVGDVRDFGLDQETEPTFYSVGAGPVMTLLVKTEGGDGGIAAALHDAVRGVDGEIPVDKVQPLEQNLADSLARRRFALTLLAVFGGMAAFLTACGVCGLLTQSVNARVRELGVRAAVGAAPGKLVAMVLREAFALAIPGLVAGVVLSLAFGRVMKSMVYQISPADPASIGSAGIFLVLVTFISAWPPARKAAAVNPAAALRAE